MIAGHDDKHRWKNQMPDVTGGDWICIRCGEYRGARGHGDDGGCPGSPPHTATTPPRKQPEDFSYPDTIAQDRAIRNEPIPEHEEHPRLRRSKPKKDKTRAERKQERSLQRQLARQLNRRPR